MKIFQLLIGSLLIVSCSAVWAADSKELTPHQKIVKKLKQCLKQPTRSEREAEAGAGTDDFYDADQEANDQRFNCGLDFCKAERQQIANNQMGSSRPTEWCAKPKYSDNKKRRDGQ